MSEVLHFTINNILYEVNVYSSAQIRVPFNLWKCYALIMKPFLPRQLMNHITKAVFGGPKFSTPGGTLRGILISAEPIGMHSHCFVFYWNDSKTKRVFLHLSIMQTSCNLTNSEYLRVDCIGGIFPKSFLLKL